MQVALFSLFLALTVLKKVVVNDKQLTFFVPSHLTEYVIQNFQMKEEKAEEEREKTKKKSPKGAGMHAGSSRKVSQRDMGCQKPGYGRVWGVS